jgi:dynein light chain 1, axonemal
LGETLEELWISYNLIEKVKGIEFMKNLKKLYIAFNVIRDWNEYSKLSVLQSTLTDLIFVGNPVAEAMDEEDYRNEAEKRLPFLKMLDGDPVLNF